MYKFFDKEFEYRYGIFKYEGSLLPNIKLSIGEYVIDDYPIETYSIIDEAKTALKFNYAQNVNKKLCGKYIDYVIYYIADADNFGKIVAMLDFEGDVIDIGERGIVV